MSIDIKKLILGKIPLPLYHLDNTYIDRWKL